MEKIQLTVQSRVPHVSQIITGFLILKEQGCDIEIIDNSADKTHPLHELPAITAKVGGKTVVYDLWDGYNDPEDMIMCLENCDFYFKRSFSQEKNAKILGQYQEKIYPLGFNYHVTHKHNPINEPLWKHLAKPLLGKTPDRYFVPEVFEGQALKTHGPVKILFLARLWDDKEPGFSAEDHAERAYINQMRIEIIRALRETYGDSFIGGLNDNALSRAWAPDLIMSGEYTERKNYLKLLHSCDICIGSMGLFESIGWKTAEYVAAAKAIVNERFHYSVPGGFEEGKNYLAFSTAAECISAVQRLAEDPEGLYRMKRENEAYYRAYLKPEMLVKNSLELVEREIARQAEK